MIILDRLIDKVGDSNPQIFRELKERLTLRNIGIAVVASLLIQGFVLVYFNGQIPVPTYDTMPAHELMETHSSYCVFPNNHDRYDSLCTLNGSGDFILNWKNGGRMFLAV